jgi:tetratricopeptide (TPR) repeat protein
LSADDPELASNYDNIGGIYQDMRQYDKALFFYEKALKINEKLLHSNHPELSVTYSPANHPSIARAYNNIGDVYQQMRQFENALSFYEKALQIQKISLPQYHSDFAWTYMQIGQVYYSIGKYSTALSYFERGLEIGEVSLPENHQLLKTLRQNIAFTEKEL